MIDNRDQPFIDEGIRILKALKHEILNGEVAVHFKIQNGYVVSAQGDAQFSLVRQEKK